MKTWKKTLVFRLWSKSKEEKSGLNSLNGINDWQSTGRRIDWMDLYRDLDILVGPIFVAIQSACKPAIEYGLQSTVQRDLCKLEETN